MSACSRKALTLLSSVFAISGLGLLGVAVSTDYWLYLEEGIIMPLNQSAAIKTSLHSGLWRVCFVAGRDLISFICIVFVVTTLTPDLSNRSDVSNTKTVKTPSDFNGQTSRSPKN